MVSKTGIRCIPRFQIKYFGCFINKYIKSACYWFRSFLLGGQVWVRERMRGLVRDGVVIGSSVRGGVREVEQEWQWSGRWHTCIL
jgi:hypothetical protein